MTFPYLKYLSLSLLAACALALISCGDDNGISLDDDGTIGDIPAPLTYRDSLDIAAIAAVATLCGHDSTSIAGYAAGAQASPRYGSQLYAITPQTRYVMVSSVADARRSFLSDFHSTLAYTRTDTMKADISIDLGEYGSIFFSTGGDDGVVATATISMPRMNQLRQVNYLMSSAWPFNDDEGWLARGNVIQRTANGTGFGNSYICLQTCGNADYGIIATFDQGYDNMLEGSARNYDPTEITDPFYQSHSNYWWEDRSLFTGYIAYSSGDRRDLESLQSFLYDSNGNRRDAADKALKKLLGEGSDLYNAVWTDGRWFLCRDNAWHYRTSNRHTYKYQYYSARKKKWTDGCESAAYEFCGTSFFIMRPRKADCELRKINWNSYETPATVAQSGRDRISYVRVRFFHYNDSYDFQSLGFSKLTMR